MTEKREIRQDADHSLPGPHLDLPGGFVPLRLVTEPDGVRIEVHRPLVIVGRYSRAALRLAYPEVSRQHCRFVFENGQWRVYDLKSLNGVFLNEERIVEATLFAGDRLRIGEVRLLIEAATPVRVVKSPAGHEDEKWRQIVRALP